MPHKCGKSNPGPFSFSLRLQSGSATDTPWISGVVLTPAGLHMWFVREELKEWETRLIIKARP